MLFNTTFADLAVRPSRLLGMHRQQADHPAQLAINVDFSGSIKQLCRCELTLGQVRCPGRPRRSAQETDFRRRSTCIRCFATQVEFP